MAQAPLQSITTFEKTKRHILRFGVYFTNCGFWIFTLHWLNLVYWVGLGMGMTF